VEIEAMSMGKRIYSLLAGMGLLLAAGQASAITIEDTYIGSNDHGYGDVIASSSDYDHYNIRNMDVSFDGTYLSVRVNTSFSESTDNFGVNYGDLFISTNGWHPAGSASDGYLIDNASNGEHWEFVFDTSAETLIGGEFMNYNSEYFFDPTQYIFRDGQEVQYAFGGQDYAGSSVDLSHAGKDGYIQYNILWSSLGLSGPADIGLKWGMTCANDTIEGQVSVPEPSALMLLGLGLLGLGVTARKRAN
jgi:hypothetical protein